eukprot:scaffold52408_cov78-Attheya_sp.AAC.4
MDGDALDTTQISSHVTSNIKWHCFAKLLEGKEQIGEATSDISEPSSRFIDVSYNHSLISATPSTQEDLLNHISTSVAAAATLPCLLNLGNSVGLDDGAMLKLGAMLGNVAGFVDTDGPTLGSNEGFMLFDGSELG